jgi:hypothetical protein
MRKVLIAALLAAVPLTPLLAQSMPVSEFLAKADALQKKGAMALFSGDIGKLKAEVVNSGKQLRAEQLAAQKAGRKPTTCMPTKGKASINSNELLAHFRSIPPAERSVPVKSAFAGLMRKKYPCPA